MSYVPVAVVAGAVTGLGCVCGWAVAVAGAVAVARAGL